MLIGLSLSFIVAAGLTPLLARWARGRGLLDVPNDRSSHSVATPRIGGLAIIAAVGSGTAACYLLGASPGPRVVAALATALLMGLLGFADDLRPLPALWRLVTQTAVAILAVRVLGPASLPWLPPWLASVLTMFWIVAVTNAVNFMDGVDGMAGAQAVVAGIGWAAVAAIAGWRDAALLGLLVALASAGFLLHNWQPARVFMGDAGSGFLGFLLAVLPLTTSNPATASAWTGVLLMWPFLFDTGFTLVRRLGHGENVLTAHRSHLYQRFTLTERSHQDVVVFYAALASLGMLAAVLLAAAQPLPAIAAIGAIPLAAFSLWRAVTAREALRRTAARP